MRVLLIEDEPGIAQFIYKGLREANYVVDIAKDGKEGKDYILGDDYDIIILDIMLPKIDGLQLLEIIRAEKILTPVLLLTAKDTVQDRVTGLDKGADDYLVKPFAFSELLARLRSLQRRPPMQIENIFQLGELSMDLAKREVRRKGKLIELSPLEFKLLEYLLRNANQVLTRTQIGEQVWNLDFYTNSNVVDVYVGYLRRKLERGFDSPLIHTVRGVGYILKVADKDDETL
jgi:DNA-binding response OmpR family regulator